MQVYCNEISLYRLLRFTSVNILQSCLLSVCSTTPVRASRIAQWVKNPPAMQETPVRFLGEEGPLEKGEAAHSNILGLPWWLSW